MNLNEWAKEIHENAISHGWWETERALDELLALIHSEWSEALEAYRDGKPLVWREGDKPEGIAVELIDGCIRILDFAEHEDIKLTDYCIENSVGWELPVFVNNLHYHVSAVSNSISRYGTWVGDDEKECARDWLSSAVNEVFDWISHRGIDPMVVLEQKHEFNKTRPYRHGGKVV